MSRSTQPTDKGKQMKATTRPARAKALTSLAATMVAGALALAACSSGDAKPASGESTDGASGGIASGNATYDEIVNGGPICSPTSTPPPAL